MTTRLKLKLSTLMIAAAAASSCASLASQERRSDIYWGMSMDEFKLNFSKYVVKEGTAPIRRYYITVSQEDNIFSKYFMEPEDNVSFEFSEEEILDEIETRSSIGYDSAKEIMETRFGHELKMGRRTDTCGVLEIMCCRRTSFEDLESNSAISLIEYPSEGACERDDADPLLVSVKFGPITETWIELRERYENR